jgi:pimeloyl-ACP methyl ester carboxylesterase
LRSPVSCRWYSRTVVSGRRSLAVPVAGGTLGGWAVGEGTPVLLLHGGPGLSFEYLDELGAELASDYQVLAYQQRGLEPSTLQGPFTIAQAITDAVAVLDECEFSRALIVGHSWGGQLALRLAAAHPERVLGVLALDPVGIVGDGGQAAFEAELIARTPQEGRARARELDERAMAGQGTAEEALESLRIFWPAYFAAPENARPMPPIRMSVEAYSGAISEVTKGTDELAAAIASSEVPYGVIAGAGSPMPWGQAARASVELSPHAFLVVVPCAGHFPWLEQPGCVLAALQRLRQ